MTDSADLDDLVAAVRDHAAEVAGLDAPRAEAWASDILALAAELTPDPAGALVAALDADDPVDRLARAAIAAVAVEVDAPPAWDGSPPWVAALGTSRCEGAWLLEARGALSVALRFVDAVDARHVLTIDLVAGSPEQVGEVSVAPGDLLDALDEEDAAIVATEAEPQTLARRIAAALAVTDTPRESTVVNGHLLVARLASITGDRVAPPTLAPDEVPAPPPRDPEADAYALDLLDRAVGPIAGAPPDRLVSVISERVAPADLGSFTPAERDAIMLLEWADWLGAVIGLVREGVGAPLDGDHFVDLVNRCPEVTTTIPAGDRARIAWAFSTLTEDWSDLGLADSDGLTRLGAAVLPAALERAWAGS